MRRWAVLAAAALVLVAIPLSAQISAYASLSAGTHSDPLYNYLQQPDRLLQHYLDLSYDADLGDGTMSVHYAGGSTFFSRFAARSYYEHRLQAVMVVPQEIPENDEGVPAPVLENNAWTLTAAMAGRFDKKEFREFDNTGIIGTVERVIPFTTVSSLRFSNMLEYRTFPSLRSFTNSVEIATVEWQFGTPAEGQIGFTVSGGWKYYPKMRYDTALFEPVRSYIVSMVLDSEQTGSGKQKQWVYYTYPDTNASEKFVLKDPKTRSAYQAATGVFWRKEGEGWSVRTGLTYRVNDHSGLLTMVQNTSDRTLNEDLYNTEFSAQGPELHVDMHWTMSADIRCDAALLVEHKVFETPSFDLATGEISAPSRTDDRLGLELTAARSFPLSSSLGMDVTVNAAMLRNRSNDAYNDFSFSTISVIVGVGW